MQIMFSSILSFYEMFASGQFVKALYLENERLYAYSYCWYTLLIFLSDSTKS